MQNIEHILKVIRTDIAAMTDTTAKSNGLKNNSSKSNGTHNIEDAETQASSKRQKKSPGRQILLNAFDMSGTIGHLSPGQWKVNSRVPT